MLRAHPPVYSPVSWRALTHALHAVLRADQPDRLREAAEQAVQSIFGPRRVILTDSGTSALALGLRVATAALAPGGRAIPMQGRIELSGETPVVAVPAYACPDVGAAVIAAGARMLLYDIRPSDLQPDLESLEHCLRAGARIIVVAHLLGRAADIPAIRALAATFGAVVVEDAAQGAGGTWQGELTGTLADISVLSFGRGKGVYAAGGGALLLAPALSEETLANISTARETGLRSLRALVVQAATKMLSAPSLYALPANMPWLKLGETVFHAAPEPHAASLATLALLPLVLRDLKPVATLRHQVGQWYREQLADSPHVLASVVPAGCDDGCLRFPIFLRRDEAGPLARDGVAQFYPRSLAEYPELASFVNNTTLQMRGAEFLAARLHTLPTHSLLTDEDRRRVVSAVQGRIRRARSATIQSPTWE